MSYAHPNPTYDHDREHEHAHTGNHDDRHPALTPLVIDVIPDQTRAELEAVIDESLAVEQFGESEDHHSFTIGTVGAGKTFNTKTEILADSREDSESGSVAASDRRQS